MLLVTLVIAPGKSIAIARLCALHHATIELAERFLMAARIPFRLTPLGRYAERVNPGSAATAQIRHSDESQKNEVVA